MAYINRNWRFYIIPTIFWAIVILYGAVLYHTPCRDIIMIEPYDATIKVKHKRSRKYLTGGVSHGCYAN